MLKPFTQRLAMLNHSYYLSFNHFQNLCIQFVSSSMYLYSYLSTHGISGLAAHGDCQQFEVSLKMTIGGHDRASREMHLEAEIE